MLKRSFFHSSTFDFQVANPDAVLGALTANLSFDVVQQQRSAWVFQIGHLIQISNQLPDGHIFLEFLIPRMGKRVDTIVLYKGLIFVVEYKVGKREFSRHDEDQVASYALDLKNFHETSHSRLIFPILVATNSNNVVNRFEMSSDGVAKVIRTNHHGLLNEILSISSQFASESIDPVDWMEGRYKPTPTIIEAAQALYQNHDVEEISRSEAGKENLSRTGKYIEEVIESSKRKFRKSICFITGVPGSGKTLAGLNIVNSRVDSHTDEHAVFLSGNGPLVAVLREALAIDAVETSKAENREKTNKYKEHGKASKFIQNIHHFRDQYLIDLKPPIEKLVVFDEAQRAWNVEQASKFMASKKGMKDFSMSEPEFLISVMDRHDDWCTIVCLVGEGQEINTGEAGLAAWMEALKEKYTSWDVHISNDVISANMSLLPVGILEFLESERISKTDDLHLNVAMRSFRAENLSNFVGAVLDGDARRARFLLEDSLKDYPVFLTRDLKHARAWLRSKKRGLERTGLLASSNAIRLKPMGVFVKAKIDPPVWFLAPSDDIRSSSSLEDAGTEFDVQGLEIDWGCVCIDANLRRSSDSWSAFIFKGTKWQKVLDPAKFKYLINSYRVLLTRSRQGMVIYVPSGDANDLTRKAEYYDPIYDYLLSCGLPELPQTEDSSGSVTLGAYSFKRESH